MSLLRFLQPEGWARASGYSDGILAQGRLVFIAGQIGWDPREKCFPSAVLADQVRQALRNVVAVLAEADARPENIVRMTWYFTSRDEYLAQLTQIGVAYRAVMGKHFPAMTAVQVVGLVEARDPQEAERRRVAAAEARTVWLRPQARAESPSGQCPGAQQPTTLRHPLIDAVSDRDAPILLILLRFPAFWWT
jgi:enamine deaminase RidA (YjgF/YER057c/UK114 family)